MKDKSKKANGSAKATLRTRIIFA